MHFNASRSLCITVTVSVWNRYDFKHVQCAALQFRLFHILAIAEEHFI